MSEEKFLTQNSGGLCRNDCYDVFMRELCGADRIVIQTKNAIGEFDGYYLSAQHLREAIKNRSAATAAAQVAAAYERGAELFDEKHHVFMVAKGRNPSDYMSEFSNAADKLRALATDAQINALERVRRDAERAGYERGARLARNMALIEAAGKCDVFDGPVSESEFVNGQSTAAQQIRAAILSLMTPDEQTEAAQELALRKAVSS